MKELRTDEGKDDEDEEKGCQGAAGLARHLPSARPYPLVWESYLAYLAAE